MKKKIILILCILAIVFSLCSCKKEEEQPTELPEAQTVETVQADAEVKNKKVVLPYTSKAKLNPYKTDSNVNKYIANLVYDPLFRLNGEYDPIEMIASSCEIDGNIVTVELRDDIVFSNGEQINTRDVIYSYQQAKASPLYAQRLANFYSCTADGDSIVFHITKPDIFAVNCLDFPIVKFGTATEEIPVGSGRYTLQKKKGKYTLRKNENYVLNEEMEQEKIELLDISTVENELYTLQIGELTCSMIDSNGSKQDKVIASKQQIGLNNLIYLGINSQNSVFDDINIRNAISLSIDNFAITENAYDGLARGCNSPFNPSWSKALVFQKNENAFDIAAANDLLEKSGYIYAYKKNPYRSKNFEFLTLDLIVNKENPGKVTCSKLIETQLESIGIDVKRYELDYDSYKNRLEASDFDLYIGEVKLTPNMDLSVFFSEDGAANYGIDTKSSVCGAYDDFISGTISISTFAKVFNEIKPFIPLCYRDAFVYYARTLKYEEEAVESDIYANIYSWSF